ncbi:MAG: helix-turn-helix domain-containing protein [Atopobiaceae bacterium]
MPIVMRLDRMMAERKVSSNDLAKKIGISPVNLSRIKTGKIKGIRFTTLEALCQALRCKPGDLIDYLSEEESEKSMELGDVTEHHS